MMEVMSMFKNNNDEKGKVVNIPIDKIKPNPYQPRKHFDKAALEELSISIKQYGILQPINVRKLGSGSYELVAGERRLRASKIADIKEIPAIVVEMNDNDSAVVALIENLQREDLSFMEEAEGYFHLISEHGFTQEELAIKVGKNQSTVANKLRLLKLPPLVKKMIGDNNLTERHARALLKLPDEQLQLKILKQVCEKGLNVKKTEELIQKTIEKYTNNAEKPTVKKQIRAFRDVRIFINTLKQAVDMMKQSGVNAKVTQSDNEDYVEYIVRIPKE
ncbi:nucleoid occlusion protein [Petroclostridium sp. X23]|uniref:nucleoid occlusion protein n=1 Tax=Petroclostridium sp. X23 TaxID=3045146 RepID=UPI0024AE5E1A|nr:nucleoid occlusion protein [Petroclostridium sp. X23]WHH57256.1 nucleoid occlusion protein [Petroclostridium sp. X23]